MGSSGGHTGGDSSSVRILGPYHLTHSTPSLLTGVVLFTPLVGEMLGGYVATPVGVPVAWNGTNPTIDIGVMVGGVTYVSLQFDLTLNMPDAAPVGSFRLPSNTSYFSSSNSYVIVQTGTDPIAAKLDDGSGGDPGSTTGELDIWFTMTGIPVANVH